MASYTGTSAITRGSVYVAGTPVPSPSPTWLNEARDNLNSIAPSPVVNIDYDQAVEASWVTLVAPNPSPPATPGSYQAVCSRYFAAFSTVSVPTQAISIQLYVHIRTNGGNELRIVKASAPSTTAGVTGGNYKAIPGLTNGTGMGGLVTDYAGPFPSPPLGWNAYQLNANAINDFNSYSELQLAIVDSAYDYGYFEMPFGSVQSTGISAGTSGPYLLVQTGSGQWVLSINPAVTKKVDGVTGTNIRNVNIITSYTLWRGPNSSVDPTPLVPPAAACFYNGDPVTLIALYCSKPLPSIIVNDIVYTDYLKTFTFNGGSLWWGIAETNPGTTYNANLYQISSVGRIEAISGGACYI